MSVDNPYDVVVKARRSPGQRIGHRRHADDDQLVRRNERLDVHVYCPLGHTGHRDDDVFGVVHVRGGSIRADRDETGSAGAQRIERLPADDFARTGAADEAVHAAVCENDRTITEVGRHRSATSDHGRRGKGLSFSPERGYRLEEVVHPYPVTLLRTFAKVWVMSF